MINLFEHFDSKTALLYQSLKLSGHNHFTTVINDNGFLPDTVTSPYQFFAEYQGNENLKPKFFNEIEIPKFWEIEGNNDAAWIKNMGKKRGNIFYKQHYKFRAVSHVEWLDEHGKVRFIDYYTKHGVKYAQTTMNKDEKPILKKYMNQKGQEVLHENFLTKSIVLDWQGKTYLFDSQVSFILFYLKEANVDLSKIMINSLATSFGVLFNLDTRGEDVLFWQEHNNGEIPGNMRLIFDEKMGRNISIVIPEKEEYDSVFNQLEVSERKYIYQGGYIYNYQKENEYRKTALIMTNSDQIVNIETIIKQNTDIDFYIGALTEMSTILMDLSKYSNVKLFPAIDQTTVQDLYLLCDLYLDINEGNEIENAVKKAFDYNLLILTYSDIAHNLFVTSKCHRFEKEHQANELNKFIRSLYADTDQFSHALTQQRKHANEIPIPLFNKVLE